MENFVIDECHFGEDDLVATHKQAVDQSRPPARDFNPFDTYFQNHSNKSSSLAEEDDG